MLALLTSHSRLYLALPEYSGQVFFNVVNRRSHRFTEKWYESVCECCPRGLHLFSQHKLTNKEELVVANDSSLFGLRSHVIYQGRPVILRKQMATYNKANRNTERAWNMCLLFIRTDLRSYSILLKKKNIVCKMKNASILLNNFLYWLNKKQKTKLHYFV